VECIVIGSPVPTSTDYARSIRAHYSDVPARWLNGLSHEEVADELARARVAYLPFPDGVSERRGSVLAALGCGLPTVTSHGSQTNPELAAALTLVSGPKQALAAIEKLMSEETAWQELSDRGRQYSSRFSWPEIARRHIALYEGVVARRAKFG
jgi:glycosyltransferase involved in cell wall biosynthesis